ncbi:hypothetical protein DM860_012929 [Cuscuta australis]|uniref:Uncharacterized protein n=1 Tax=Cuscuta australis TaxID=267555 RepID=A0A328DW08_9ASTE|nr:hypothetical protein DM860_012929 [Cuscuta australis]
MVMVPTTPTTDGEDHGNSDCSSGGSSPSSVSTTNWLIAHGSLESAVTVESSDSPPTDPDSTPKSPLIAKPHSPDSDPCEIKICFARKHEILQVYVRSTARVYEIYYASSLHGENVYLCTVRCCVAEREGEVLLAGSEYGDASKHHIDVTKGGPRIERFTGKENTGSNSEEEWVDVKVPGFPVDENEINLMVNQSSASNGTGVEDLYEATAEIRDAEPCASLTIRFLSLQSKDCLYLDELYIFGDPFVSTDSENHPTPAVESSAHSSLMAMLIPTFLQLSKSTIRQTADTHSSDNRQKKGDDEPTVRRTDMHDGSMNGINCEQSSMVANGHETQPPKQLTTSDKNNAPAEIGNVLGQLVDRVNRIEEICLRFEESMLKPISSMEVRLQRVEEQIDILAKNSQYAVLPSCKRFTAPSFSCTDSNFGSFYNDGNNQPPNLASELKMDCPDEDKLSSSTDSSSISASSPRVHPSLVIAAPEFPCGEEEEQSRELEHLGMSGAAKLPSKNSPEEGNRKTISIDDALAAALSGFLSTSAVSLSESNKQTVVSSSESHVEASGHLECSPNGPVSINECIKDEAFVDQPSKCNQNITITAPEFTLEDLIDSKDNSPGVGNLEPLNCISEGSQSGIKPQTVENGGDGAAEDSGLTITSHKFTLEELKDMLREQGSDQTPSVNDINKHHVVNEEKCSSHILGESQTETKPEPAERSCGIGDDILLGDSRHSVPCMDYGIPILDVSFRSHEEEDSGTTTLPLDILLGGGGGDTENNAISGVDTVMNSDSLMDYNNNNNNNNNGSSNCCADVDDEDDGRTTPFAEQGAFVVSSLI